MAKQQTREEAEVRILERQAELATSLEANPRYQELSPEAQQQVFEDLMPRLFDPRAEIVELLKDIAAQKLFIKLFNNAATKEPSDSESWADAVNTSRQLIAMDVERIKQIKRGEFKWLVI